MKACWWVLMLSAALVAGATSFDLVCCAAEPLSPSSSQPMPSDPETVRLTLMDGSVISGKLSVREIVVETQFGKLSVPVTSLRSFTPGLASHPDLSKKVYDLIDQLGSSDFDQRELAQKELMSLGQSVRAELEKRVKDPDTERRMRITAILDELESERDDEDEPSTPSATTWIQRDTIETTEFTAVGKIATPTFTIASLYGPLTIKLSDIRRGQRDDTKKPDVRKSITVDGSHLVQRSFKESGVRVEKGDKVTVTAEGSIAMTPWGNNMFSTPDGGANFGWYVQNSIPSGTLVASIGSHDDVFKVGSKSTFRVEHSGMLRFGVAMQADYVSQEFPGNYTVKIRVERR